jgi:ABC-type Mn2+/Zn2+ transport system permease subunit
MPTETTVIMTDFLVYALLAGLGVALVAGPLTHWLIVRYLASLLVCC